MSTRKHKNKADAVVVNSVKDASPSTSLTGMSPTMISRVQEKNELASLNDRLATYIERVQMLEGENIRLTRVVQTQEDVTIKEVHGIKALYQSELANVRELLDELAKDRAILLLENGKFKSEVEDLRAKLRRNEQELSAAAKKLLTAESQVVELKARANDSVSQCRHWEDEHSKLKKELEILNKGLTTAKKQLEDETMMRVDLENHIQSLKEDLLFKSQVHEQELSECMKRSQIHVEELDVRMQREYDNKLGESLVRMREDMEQQLRRACHDTEHVLERKLAEMHSLAEQNIKMSEKAHTDLRSSHKKSDELDSEVSRLTAQNHEYLTSIRNLQRERDTQGVEIEVLRNQVERLRGEMEDHVLKYRDLMEIKVKLDNEISVYRKLLESEEARFKPSVVETTPGPLLPRKRRKMDDDLSDLPGAIGETLASSEFEVISTAKGIVKISEICTDGQFVKLVNTSNDKKATLGGWQIHQAGAACETKYKFPRNIFLKPQQSVTIWSCTSGQTHSPPTNLLMTNQVWQRPTADRDQCTTVLLDLKREEMASYETKKAASSSSSQAAQELDTSRLKGQQSQSERKSWGWSLFSIMM